ncbi:flagellar assembly protein FliH [Natranaerovirga hydrolytica]|uniref:Flagellar assembly protein FliH n=1 Tax=Natranaerovirga hydrolytica TaxID=680378 RepID=A0A4R1N4L7_9FIRM|nr:FliH/SctL family protein [Natranaerovirga hydrolytica]TCK97889.1 flagellar assembly protein FliH [Natranaerovirga hydrolytica]
MSNLFKSSFVSFTPEDKKLIKIESEDPRILKSTNPKKEDYREIIKKKETTEKEKVEKNLQEAEAILKEAKLEAEMIKKNAYEEGKKSGYEKGYDSGYSEGYEVGKQEAEQLKAEVDKQEAEMIAKYEGLIEKLEPRFVQLVINIVEKLTGVLVEDKKELILNIINNGIQSKDTTKEYVINVSDEDYNYIIDNSNAIHNIGNPNVKIDIISNTKLSKGQCFIETSNGIINSSVDVQLKELISDLKVLARI